MAPKGSKKARKREEHFRKQQVAKKQKKHPPSFPQSEDPILFGSDPNSDSDDDTPTPTSSSSYSDEDLHKLLEPYSKDQLISFLCDAAVSETSLLSKIRSVADRDVSHRKVFVHGLGWDTTREALIEAFSPFGTIEDCNVVVDKATGRAKGYGFVLFETRRGAAKALKQPQKKIKNRVASCQLASVGPTPSGSAPGDTTGRKIYVSNVHADAAPDKLREFFSKFGEIETGPLGYDMLTGKSRGFALFVYKTQEEANKVLEEPYKMFEGHQLHCQRATESSKGKGSVGAVLPPAIPIPAAVPSTCVGVYGAASQPVLAAVAAAQNLALFGQNPAYGALLGQNPFMAAALSQTALNQAAFSPVAAAALSPATINPMGGLGGSSSLLGAYGAQGTAGPRGMPYGQSSFSRPTGSYGGMPPYLW